MSTPNTVPTSTPVVTLDWNKATEHLSSIKKKIFEYEGKQGHNPYMWWAEHGATLETKMSTSTRDGMLYANVMSLKFEVPKAPDMGVRLRKPSSKPSNLIIPSR